MILLNYESDCSILDSSIPPKGISQKQWEKNRQETIKSIEDLNISDKKLKSLPKRKNGQSQLQISSENIYSSGATISDSFSIDSFDDNIKTPKRFKLQSKNVSINHENEKQRASKAKDSDQNKYDNKISESNNSSKYQKKHDNDKKSNISNFQDSSSVISTTIEDYQKDLWIQRSLKSITSIKNSPKKQDKTRPSIESDNSLSNGYNSTLKDRKNISDEILSNEKSSSENQVNVNKDDVNSEDNNSSEIIKVSCNRSGKINTNDINDNIQNSNNNGYSSDSDVYSVDIIDENYNNNDKNGNDNNYDDNIDDKSKNIPTSRNYKDRIKWEFKSFNNIFDVESPKGSNIRKKSLKKQKASKSNPQTSSNVQGDAQNTQTKQRSVKKRRKAKRNAKDNPDQEDQSPAQFTEKQIEPEIGQLELPSSSAYEVHPKLCSSEVEVEVNFFDNEELINSPKPSYISHINRSGSKSENFVHPTQKEREIETVSKSAKILTQKNNKKGKNYPFDEGSSSEAQAEVLVSLRKTTEVLSSETESDDQNEHQDKTVSMNGIVLFMLSSSDTEAAAKKGRENLNENENNGQTFTVSDIGEKLSEYSRSSQRSNSLYNEAKIESNSESNNLYTNTNLNVNDNSKLNTDTNLIANDNSKLNIDTNLNNNVNSNLKTSDTHKRRRGKRNLVASLTIVQAHGLPDLNVPRRDPYCLVGLKGCRDPMKTKVMRDTTSPIWNSKFSIDVKNADIPLIFTVRYEDKFGGDIDVAVGEMNLKSAEKGKYYESWVRLHPVSGISINDQKSISSACELYVTFVLDTKKSATIPSTIITKTTTVSTPKSNQKISNSPDANSTPKVRTPSSPGTPLTSPFYHYEGELIMTLTVVQAKNVILPHQYQNASSGIYCAVNVVGRRDVRKTKTVTGTFSPIWDKQFKFILANQHDLVQFNIRVEDRSRGDLFVSMAEIGVDEIPLNSFADKKVPLHPLKKAKRMPIKTDDFSDDQGEIEANLNLKDNINEQKSVGKLHFTLVLEPRLKDIPVSPRASPSPISNAVFADFGYPESPMSHYIQRENENDEN